jgi:hypothetical protein
MAKRRVAIAIPARDESGRIARCVDRLMGLAADPRHERPVVVVLANNCEDATARIAAARGAVVVSVRLPAERAHAGWARRLALEAAASHLREHNDALVCTDADTRVAPDWLARTFDHLDRGWDAVAGLARLDPRELRHMPPAHRARLAEIRRYAKALDYLRAREDTSEPWPRHFYEGGASIAMTLGAFEDIGEAPTPRVGEDRALFDALRRCGRSVRHPLDVRVATSPRLIGRAGGGASDTLALWGRQGDDEPIWEIKAIDAALGRTGAKSGEITFRTLETETDRARSMVALARRDRGLALAS